MPSPLLTLLSNTVLLCDGATGSQVQGMTLDVAADFLGCENCTEILNVSRPDVVRDIHRRYLMAGSDVVQTNSFGGSPITLGEFGLTERCYEINVASARLARDEVASVSAKDGRARFVVGSIGPGTKLPSLGHIGYGELEAGFTAQATALAEGGVDGFLIETCQDPLQIKAAINGVKAGRVAAHRPELPILVQVTVETTGTLLVGTDIGAAVTILDAMDVDLLGMNCATGPQEMRPHIAHLAQHWPRLISVQPNAGLPCLKHGKTHYPLTPEEMVAEVRAFIQTFGVNLVGGCCGTTPEHIQALHTLLHDLAGEHPSGALGYRPAVYARPAFQGTAGVASLYTPVTLRQENAFFAIGERCNANGSKLFRQRQEAQDWDGCVAMAREQEGEGSHALDVCTAFVGRDELADMTALVSRLRGSASVPLVIDSTETPVLEGALALYGGKPIINSINFEDGDGPAHVRMKLAKKFGAAVIALTIDEEGMAKTPDKKLAVAQRLFDFACGQYGLAPSDLMFDPLTFTICTGNEDDRLLGVWTLDAIEQLRDTFPECQIILGLSNISFGLNPAARQVLNSVYLDHAIRRGLTGAIVHVSKILPLHQIPAEQREAAENLIFDRRTPDYDPLQHFIGLFTDAKAITTSAADRLPDVLEERLQQRIIDGVKPGLEDDLTQAMTTYSPLDIINTILLEGMRVVGELFGSGKMQLPFVLQSAETMKAAVKFLEPFMEKADGQQKGTLVLATVKGDVHDIGKNLVDIILTNNGYRVINLGIKQPIENILKAAQEHQADAIGLSGLLVKSTVIMRENMAELTRQGMTTPVFLGGAALTRAYVEEDCVDAYGCGRVAYAADAFDSLRLMELVMTGQFDDYLNERQSVRHQKAAEPPQVAQPEASETPSGPAPAISKPRQRTQNEISQPPFWGQRFASPTLEAVLPYLDKERLFTRQWGFEVPEGTPWQVVAAEHQLEQRLADLLAHPEIQRTLELKVTYGFWPCYGDGGRLVILDPVTYEPCHTFQVSETYDPQALNLTDYLVPVEAGYHDVIGLNAVTLGQPISELSREWFQEDRYQDYLFLHGLLGELTEALSVWVHEAMRQDLGVAEAAAMRYGIGWELWPWMGDQSGQLALLYGEQLGLHVGQESGLIQPESSASGVFLLSIAAD